MALEYVIYCDESEEKGRHFSDFYGGVLICSDKLELVRSTLAACKAQLNLKGEVKWSKITENYADKYIALMDCFFNLVASGAIKVRIMFTQNTIKAKGLTPRHIDEKYFILYYEFLKHGFGLDESPKVDGGVELRIYPDQLPATKERVQKFRSYLVALERAPAFRKLGIRVRPENIADVCSHDHDALQCLDVVLGAVHFRLNDKHKDKPPGKHRRGKRTIAKERVYKHINGLIQAMLPHFNIGISTGDRGVANCRWNHPYSHWRFVPKQHIVVAGSKRKKKKKAP